MKTSDLDYHLPDELIAQRPLPERDASRLLVVDRSAPFPGIAHRCFRDILEYLGTGDVLVRNRSRVVTARLFGHRRSGARIEILAMEAAAGGRFKGIAKPSARLRVDESIRLEGGHVVTVFEKHDDGFITFTGDLGACRADGNTPLPPYIRRHADVLDRERYQTVYADCDGSIAAPTAGLHFTQHLLRQLQAQGVDLLDLSLHVGLGTFRPVRTEDIADHEMHEEQVEIPESTARALGQAADERRRVIAIGTTSARALESMVERSRGIEAGKFTTRIFIRPGHRFQMVSGLLTNFHQPRSTLLALVYAFAGTDRARAAYAAALTERYRFLSYGDAMLIL